ncbi:MAG: hypothetical protein FIB02_03205 [Desulfuromonas sp.]|nr:hypothetical protein [Desulfuromonas sp.]
MKHSFLYISKQAGLFISTLVILISIGVLHPISASAMEPDAEMLNDPQFLSEYNCLPEYFKLSSLFEANKWKDALKLIDHLEKSGRIDRFLTVAKSKAFSRLAKYDKALIGFNMSFTQDYLCKLTIPKFNFADNPEVVRQAVVWYYISQVYDRSGAKNKSKEAYNKAYELMKKALEYIPEQRRDKVVRELFQDHLLFTGHLKP